MSKGKLPKGVEIPDIEALNEAIADGNEDFAIVLGGGLFTRKTIWRIGKKYRMFNGIDGTVSSFTRKQLLDTLIGRAMKAGRFVALG